MNLFELEQEQEQSKPILYVDMDGVLADFYGPFNKMAGVSSWKQASKDTVSKVLRDISKSESFWLDLAVLPDAPKLMQAIQALFQGQYKVLSKALAGDQKVKSQKMQWMQQNLSLQPNEIIIMPATADKGIYAKQSDGTANILIDDFGYNIKKWQTAGGIGIQHSQGNINTTIQQMKKQLI